MDTTMRVGIILTESSVSDLDRLCCGNYPRRHAHSAPVVAISSHRVRGGAGNGASCARQKK